MSFANRSEQVWVLKHVLDRGHQFLRQLFSTVGQITGEVMALEMLPEAFDGIEVRTVRRKKLRSEVMPVQRFCSAVVLPCNLDSRFLIQAADVHRCWLYWFGAL